MSRFLTAGILQQQSNLKELIPLTGLVAGYRMNGNANDVSENNFDGNVSGATLDIDRFGNPNSSYKFQNDRDRIALPLNQNFNIINNGTIFFWVKINIFPTTFYNVYISVQSSSKVLQCYVTDNGNLAMFTNKSNIFSKIIPDTNWHSVAYVLKPDDSCDLYFDNVFVENKLSMSFQNLTITESYLVDSSSNIPKMNLDNFFIYNRQLSTSELTDLYNLI